MGLPQQNQMHIEQLTGKVDSLTRSNDQFQARHDEKLNTFERAIDDINRQLTAFGSVPMKVVGSCVAALGIIVAISGGVMSWYVRTTDEKYTTFVNDVLGSKLSAYEVRITENVNKIFSETLSDYQKQITQNERLLNALYPDYRQNYPPKPPLPNTMRGPVSAD